MKKLKLTTLLLFLIVNCYSQLIEVKSKNFLKYKHIDSLVKEIDKQKLFTKKDTIIQNIDHFIYQYDSYNYLRYFYDSSGNLLKVISRTISSDTTYNCSYYYYQNKPIKITAKSFFRRDLLDFAVYYIYNKKEIYSKRNYDVSALGYYIEDAEKYHSRFIQLILKDRRY